MLTINQHFEAAVQRFAPERVAFVADSEQVTYAALETRISKLASRLHRLGIRAGSVVGYSLPNGSDVIVLFLAISRLGASAVPLFAMLPDTVRAGIFAALECSLVVVTETAAATLSVLAERMHAKYRIVTLLALREETATDTSTQDPSAELLGSAVLPNQRLIAAASSGTTGAPKFVWITQANAAAVATATADLARVGSWANAPEFSSMMAFPLSTSAILVVIGFALAGVTLVFTSDMSPVRFLELAERWKVDSLSAPPSYFENILALPKHLALPLPRIRAIFTGMDFLNPSLLARLCERLPGLDRAASGYGIVETSTVFLTWKAHARSDFDRHTNVFSICPGVNNELDVRDENGRSVGNDEAGELWVRGPSVVAGYLGKEANDSPAFLDGWFRTGDTVRKVSDTSVELLGRQKYLIKRGGKSISPLEVQAKLDACQGVVASAVVGVKQPLYGEMIWAYVVPDAAMPPSMTDLMKACRSTLPNYMVPDQVTFIEELPKGSGVGKLDREALIQRAMLELGAIQGDNNG